MSDVYTRSNAMVTLRLDPQSDIAKALASVDSEPVVLISNGERFRVSRDEATPLDDDDEFRTSVACGRWNANA